MPLEGTLITIQTPLGEGELTLKGFVGGEAISSLFDFTLDLVSENNSIVFEDIIGQPVAITVKLIGGEERYFHGIVVSFSQGEGVEQSDGTLQLTSYSARMVPWFWLLTKTTNSRIFQNMSVPDIVEQIFTEKGFPDYSLNLNGDYPARTYCVQYQETDFNFISRLLEEEGVYYFFEHEQDKHTLILADTPEGHSECPHQATARYHSGTDIHREEDVVTHVNISKEITFGKYTTKDFNFTTPSTDLQTEVTSAQTLGPRDRELYFFPGEYDTRERGDHLANLRMQAEEARVTSIRGNGNCRAFTSGYKFNLQEFYRSDMNGDYVITSVEHVASEPIGLASGGGQSDGAASYSNSFTCLPADVPYRPPLNTPKPLISGTQTAIVVGPPGEEIYPDEYGRVKVQFHWDRDGEMNENSSCWVRVSQSWGGAGWGAMFIPRINHEVIVQFIEGDPDRPIITGRVYHGQNMPPYTLPDEKTKSTIKSETSPGGGGSNEIRFEDSAGDEEVYVHAQLNMNSVVENDKTLEVGNDRTTHVVGNFEETIDGNETRTVSGAVDETISGGETRTVDSGLTETITGGETRTVTGGLEETINGDETRNVNGNQTKTIVGSKTEDVVGGITVTTPATYDITAVGGLTMTAPAGVTVNAPGGYTLVAPGGNNTIDSWFTSIGGKNEDFFSIVNQATGMKNEFVGSANTGATAKIDLSGFVFERTYAKNDNEPIGLKKGGINLAKGALTMLQYTAIMLG